MVNISHYNYIKSHSENLYANTRKQPSLSDEFPLSENFALDREVVKQALPVKIYFDSSKLSPGIPATLFCAIFLDRLNQYL